MNIKPKIAIKILAPLFLLAPLASCSAIAELTGVSLDVYRVEEMIEDGILEQGDIIVVATCPDPMVGKVGETRTCSIEDEYGETELVDVTIQNAEGDVVWEVRG